MSNSLIEVSIILIASLFMFLVVEVTFGAVIDAFAASFMMLESARPVWTSRTLSLFAQFHRVILLLVIITIVWGFRTIVAYGTYTRTKQSW